MEIEVIRDGDWWLFSDGTRLPVVAGGAPDGDGDDGDKGGAGDDGKDGDDKGDDGKGSEDDDELKDLPDKAKAVIVKERAARAAAERKAEAERKKADKAEKAAKTAREGNATEEEKKLNAAREEASKEATKKAEGKLIAAAVRVAAAGKMGNPALATKLIDLEQFEVDDDGEVDDKAINKAIDGLLEENPELALKKKSTKSGGVDGNGKTTDGGDKPDMNVLLRAAAGKG